jgi:hypothetical protein
MSTITDVKKAAFKSSAYVLIDGIKKAQVTEELKLPEEYTKTYDAETVVITNNPFTSGQVHIDRDGIVTLVMVCNDVYCANGEIENLEITEKTEVYIATLDDFDYSYITWKDNALKIFDYSGISKNVEIPDSFDGHNVYHIDRQTFDSQDIEQVILPQQLAIIDQQAFQMNKLTSLIIPSSVKYLNSKAFYVNDLKTVVFEGVTPPTMGDLAFSRNSHLYTYCIPEGASVNDYRTEIDKTDPMPGYEVIAGKYGACSEIGIGTETGESSLSCGLNAYQSGNACSCYDNYSGDASVECTLDVVMDEYTFNMVEWIDAYELRDYIGTSKDVIVPSNRESLDVKWIGVKTYMDDGINSIIFNEQLTRIDMYALKNNNLTKVIIPASVTEIKHEAFRNNDLESITFKGNVPTISATAFNENNITKVCVPVGKTTEYKTVLDLAITGYAIYEDETQCN